ncbi:hypothetical protein MKW98_023075 [Papaver atlanticum]|uniref:Uncharacterized protein n=1 Tax=Papaver atlanticum TaxID=357466 RepID=A0AAD4T7X1_9MAGN|nr:hypothetical protein MKW98_023075 [Papaver atlanticum]
MITSYISDNLSQYFVNIDLSPQEVMQWEILDLIIFSYANYISLKSGRTLHSSQVVNFLSSYIYKITCKKKIFRSNHIHSLHKCFYCLQVSVKFRVKFYTLEKYRNASIKLNISHLILYTKRNQNQNPILLLSYTSFGKMSDVPTRNYIAHLTEVLEDQVQPLSTSLRYYVEFLRDASEAIEKRRYPRVIVKLFKEIKKADDPRGLKTGEMAYALNMAWSPTGRIIIRKTADPKIFIIRFSNAADFADAIYSIPNRVHGKLLSMRMFNSDTKVEEVDFIVQDYWVRLNLRGDLVEKGFVAKQVACKIGRVLTLIGFSTWKFLMALAENAGLWMEITQKKSVKPEL